MTRFLTALALALTGLTAAAVPAEATTCDTYTVVLSRTTQGWHPTTTVRRTRVCRNDAGQVVLWRVRVLTFAF